MKENNTGGRLSHPNDSSGPSRGRCNPFAHGMRRGAGVLAVIAGIGMSSVGVGQMAMAASSDVVKSDPCGTSQDTYTIPTDENTYKVALERGGPVVTPPGTYPTNGILVVHVYVYYPGAPLDGFASEPEILLNYTNTPCETTTATTTSVPTTSTTTTSVPTTTTATSTTVAPTTTSVPSTTNPVKKPVITNITATCAGGGVLTVTNPVAGATITLGLFYHVPGDAKFYETSDDYRTTITLVAGQTKYPYTINVTSGYPSNANTLRVQVVDTAGADYGSSVNEKSPSFGPCRVTPTTTTTSVPTTSTTTTSVPTTTTSTTSAPTSTTTPTTTQAPTSPGNNPTPTKPSRAAGVGTGAAAPVSAAVSPLLSIGGVLFVLGLLMMIPGTPRVIRATRR